MPDPSNRGDLRLSIPADAAFHAVARDVATRFAEYSGAASNAARKLGEAVERIAGKMKGENIEFAMESRARLLTVRASSGAASEEASCPLPD
jgi:hypothetical protein